MSRFDDTIGVRRDEVGALLNDTNRRLTDLEAGTGRLTTIDTDIPFVDTTFTPLYDRTDPKWVYVTLKFGIPGSTFDLHIVLIERALAVDSSSFRTKRLKVGLANDIEDAERAAQSVTDRLDEPLKYATTYDVLRLIAEDADGGRVSNPENTDFSGYPGNVLFSFTTPERFNTPSAPNSSLIVYNKLDDTTPDIYDAVVGLLQFAPTTDAGAAQSYRTAGVIEVGSNIARPVPSQPDQVLHFPRTLNETELDQIADGLAGRPLSTPAGRGYVIIPATGLHPAGSYTWIENWCRTLADKKRTIGSVVFSAAGLGNDLSTLTNTALTVTPPDSSVTDGKFVQFNLELTQTEPPTGLKNGTLKLKKTADSIYGIVPGAEHWNQIQSDAYHQPDYNPGTITGNTGTNVVTGTGTLFKLLRAGWKIKVGAQTLTLADTPSSDLSLTLTANPGSNFTAQPYTVVMRIPVALAKVKPSTGYSPGAVLTLRGRGDTNTPLALSVNFTTDADGNIINDTAAPGSLNTPKLWFKRGKLHGKMSMSGLTNINSLATVEATITDGSFSLNLDDLDSDTKASGVVYYQIGRDDCVINTPISLKQARRIFGDVQLKLAFRLTNSIGQTTSSFSALLSTLSGLTDYSPNSGGGNELWNGDFTNDNESSSTTLAHWEQYRITNGNFLVMDTSTTRGRWDRTNHLAFWHQNDSSTNKVYIYQSLFQSLVFGDFHSFSFFLSSDSSLSANFDCFIGAIIEPLTGTWSINGTTTVSGSSGAALSELVPGAEVAINNEVRIVANVANNNSFTVTVAFAGTAGPTSCHAVVPVSDIVSLGSQTYTTTEKYVEATVQIDPALATNFSSRDLYVLLRTSTTISTSGPYLQVGRVMMVIGKTPVQFDRKNIKERNTSTTGLSAGSPVASEDLSFVPTGGIGGDQQFGSGAFGDVPTKGGFILQ